jgi:hypothetical protein
MLNTYGSKDTSLFRVSLVANGLLIGIPLAIGVGRLMAAQLFEIRSWDPHVCSGFQFRPGLERVACECYRVVREHLENYHQIETAFGKMVGRIT